VGAGARGPGGRSGVQDGGKSGEGASVCAARAAESSDHASALPSWRARRSAGRPRGQRAQAGWARPRARCVRTFAVLGDDGRREAYHGSAAPDRLNLLSRAQTAAAAGTACSAEQAYRLRVHALSHPRDRTAVPGGLHQRVAAASPCRDAETRRASVQVCEIWTEQRWRSALVASISMCAGRMLGPVTGCYATMGHRAFPWCAVAQRCGHAVQAQAREAVPLRSPVPRGRRSHEQARMAASARADLDAFEP